MVDNALPAENKEKREKSDDGVFTAALHLRYGYCSIAGAKEHNDDSVEAYLPEEPALTTKGAVFLIADGVSTAEKGKEASELCASLFVREYYHTPELWSVKKAGHNTLTAINRKLYAKNHEFQEPSRGYATTLSLVVVKSHIAHIFHVGDSRIHLLRGDRLETLTEDHSELNQNSYALTRAMGIDVALQVDYRQFVLRENDCFLMTTDGIHDFIDLQSLQKVIQYGTDDLTDTCQQLSEMALANGSKDNISCQIFQTTELSARGSDDLHNLLSMKPFPPPLSVGYKVDGYRVIKEIHASSRSQVYLVVDEQTDRQLVMKTPSINYQDDSAYIDRFCVEEWVGRRIDSEHVVKVITPDRKKSFLYYLMEYVEGESLESWMLRNKRPTGGKVLAIAKGIAAGVIALHDVETIHRDLKPGNIIIDQQGKVKIVDLGSVHVASIAEIQSSIDAAEVLGTVNYTDPEYILGKAANTKMDQFSLASIVYEMLTETFPYENALEKCKTENDFKKIKYTLSFKHNQEIPIWFDGALKKAVSINPADRYPDLDSFIKDLSQPNPGFLTNEYMIHLEDTLPTVDVAVVFSFFWAGSIILAILVYFI